MRTISQDMLLAALKQVAEDTMYQVPYFGICHGLDMIYWNTPSHISDADIALAKEADEQFRWVCTMWPHYSGSVFYPISVPGSELEPIQQFALGNDNWNRETQYGQLRWDLLHFAIKYLENENVPQNAK